MFGRGPEASEGKVEELSTRTLKPHNEQVRTTPRSVITGGGRIGREDDAVPKFWALTFLSFRSGATHECWSRLVLAQTPAAYSSSKTRLHLCAPVALADLLMIVLPPVVPYQWCS